MKMSAIREMTTEEILERIDAERDMLRKLKMNNKVTAVENPMKIRFTRRIIARLLTEMTHRKRQNGGKKAAETVKQS